MPRKKSPDKSGFGSIDKLPSGRFRARYTHPAIPRGPRVGAPRTFDTQGRAQVWLEAERRYIDGLRDLADYRDPQERARSAEAASLTFAEFVADWLPRHASARALKPKTVSDYNRLLDKLILPVLGDLQLLSVTPDDVNRWFHGLDRGNRKQNANAYTLLKGIFRAATRERRIASNPVDIPGASTAPRKATPVPATPVQLQQIADAMPPGLEAAVLIGGWCGLREGEVLELRRRDLRFWVDASGRDVGIIEVRRAVVKLTEVAAATATLHAPERWCGCRAGCIVGRPKSEKGVRDVPIPPHIIPALREHLASHVGSAADSLLFATTSGGHLNQSTLVGVAPTVAIGRRKAKPGRGFYRARAEAGRPDLRWHDLRHTGLSFATHAGATPFEVMRRGGHSTLAAATIYQHAEAERDQEIARKISERALGAVEAVAPSVGDRVKAVRAANPWLPASYFTDERTAAWGTMSDAVFAVLVDSLGAARANEA